MRSASSRSADVAVRPAPGRVRVALGFLGLLGLVCLVKTLPGLAPEKVIVRTQSRLQIPVDVLFNRVAALRPRNELSARDEALRAKFVNLESRLLYLQLGLAVLAECPFCNAEDPSSYLFYALTDILWPHLANVIAIALVTSPSWTGPPGSQWRLTAVIAAGLVAGLEVYLLSTYNYQANARSLRLQNLDFFFCTLRTYHYLGLAALDALLGLVLYLSATNRAFVKPPLSEERIAAVTRTLMTVKSKMSAMGIVKNTALRDEELRSRCQAYWSHEVRLMRDAMEEREVIEGINDALSNRIDMQTILRDAEAYSKSVLQPLQEQADADGA